MIYRYCFFLGLLSLCGCSLLPTNTSKPSTSLNLTTEQQSQFDAEHHLLSHQCMSDKTKTDPQAFVNVWQRIQSQFNFEIPEQKRIRSQKKWYLDHPSYMQRVSKRATPYLFHIVEELEKHELPLELALLPIVESAYDPFAYSHGRASGMWQFIPSTGKNFGLKQNWWYDGRRDIQESTKAAIKFLSYLNKRFKGNWLYALAAYNSGEGNVRRAIRINKRKGRPIDFWSLNLPRETKAYVPKLLALAEILNHSYNNQELWTPINNQVFFEQAEIDTQIDLSLAAALAEISMDEFYQLNPAYNHWATAPKKQHSILLPVDKISIFKNNLKLIPKNQRISYKKYTIKSGDSLIKIANKFSTTTQLLKQHNKIRGSFIRVGKNLLIPVASKAREQYHKSSQQRLLAKQNTKRQGKKVIVRVKNGDSMWDLSRQYKVNIRSLAKWNNIAPTDPLKIGQKLVIWTKQIQNLTSLASSNKKNKRIVYKVRRGDSLAKIADKFKVSLNNVKRWNRKNGSKKYLKPGDFLTLYIDITRQF